MQYVRSMSGAVSKTWNSINPATLSGAIDVIVVEQEDGSLACSPFHIRFGKFSLLRPFEKKVAFQINGEKQDFPMKLGEGGEAFFVFETQDEVPEALQTSPLVSPVTSPNLNASQPPTPIFQEPDPLDLESPSLDRPTRPLPNRQHSKSTSGAIPILHNDRRTQSDAGRATPRSASPDNRFERPLASNWSDVDPQAPPKLERTATDSAVPAARAAIEHARDGSEPLSGAVSDRSSPRTAAPIDRSPTQVPAGQEEAKARALNLSKKLWTSNISNQVTESGDLVLDMTGFKSSDGEALHAELIARQLLSEEINGPYDIGALIGADERGNIWIYSSEEAKEAAAKTALQGLGSLNPAAYASAEALSDPGYQSDDSRNESHPDHTAHHVRHDSDSAVGMASQPSSPGRSNTMPATTALGDPNKNYAKTLRLTSEQLKTINLQAGGNSMAFTVNRATCHATLWYWRHDVPIVISDIDGTITKSDVLGHVLNSIGRDWTHQGVAKLYTDIALNGYNFLYLTSRSVGQADTTRAYLDGVLQEGYRLPKGPVILSPDRTIAALRREIYLRKPEIFKMACLRDIMALFAGHGGSNNVHESAEAGLHSDAELSIGRDKSGSPFYAGFGNRLTDALSYRSVNIPSTRIFTINSNSEVSLDLLTLNKYKTAYGTMREIVDHYFPPVGLLVQGGGEEFTDFNYWRDKPLGIVDFTDSESDEDDDRAVRRRAPSRSRPLPSRDDIVSDDDEAPDEMIDSYLSDPRTSLDASVAASVADEDEDDPSEIETTEDEDDGDEDQGSIEEDDEDDVDDDDDDEDGIRAAPRTPQMTARRQETNVETTPKQDHDDDGVDSSTTVFRGLTMSAFDH